MITNTLISSLLVRLPKSGKIKNREIMGSRKLLLLATVLLVSYPETESQWATHPQINPPPLCSSQFALVNHACVKLPIMPPIPPPLALPPPLPPPPLSPPPPSSETPNNQSHSRHGHHHRGHGHRETAVEEECCRWLKVVDSVCVCELLIHLPPFLVKPVHNYSVAVDETCAVTFSCSSVWLP